MNVRFSNFPVAWHMRPEIVWKVSFSSHISLSMQSQDSGTCDGTQRKDPNLEPQFAVSSCERLAPRERVFLHSKAQLIRSLSRYAIVYSISNMVKHGPIHSSTQIQPLYETRMFALTVSSRDSKLNVFSVHGTNWRFRSLVPLQRLSNSALV